MLVQCDSKDNIASRIASQAEIKQRFRFDNTSAITNAADIITEGVFYSKEVKYEAQTIHLFISNHFFHAHHF